MKHIVTCITAFSFLINHSFAQYAEPAVATRSASDSALGAQIVQCRVAVLGYGRIASGEGTLSAADFEQQMNFLRDSGANVISCADFLAWRKGQRALPACSVLLTFDSPNQAFLDVALPVLQRCGFPFVVFTDAEQSAEGALQAPQLLTLQYEGAEIGSCAAGDVSSEQLTAAALRVTSTFGACRVFSCTTGEISTGLQRALGQSHFEVAFTREPEKGTVATHAHAYPRYAVSDNRVFAQAVTFGSETSVDEVVEALAACAPAVEVAPAVAAVPAAANAAVVLPEFTDDDLAEEVSEEELLAVADPSGVAVNPAVSPLPAAPAAPAEPAVPAAPVAPVAPAEPAAPVESAAPAAPAEPAVPAEPAAPAAPAEPAAPVESAAPAAPAEPEVAEESTEPEVSEAYPELAPVEPSLGVLGRRTPEGDWVSAQFKQPLVPREQTRVAVLGYHNFSKTRPCTDMRMSTADFCRQMQFLRDSNICVISMQDFLEWRHGRRCLPERCVLITIDDGWKSVYSEAYPVLRAYGYPFTLFLYTRYINVQGDSMTTAQIQEMMANGATIGSHSSNHLYPSKWRRYNQASSEYAAQLRTELVDSRTRLMNMFGNCSTYCYPGGYNTPPMIETLREAGYQAAFTVLERKVECEEEPFLVHRYMVFGTDHEIFRRAVNFDGEAGVVPTRAAIAAAEAPARAFFPAAFEGCTNRGGASAAASRSTSQSRSSAPATRPAARPEPQPAAPVTPVAPAAPALPAAAAAPQLQGNVL